MKYTNRHMKMAAAIGALTGCLAALTPTPVAAQSGGSGSCSPLSPQMCEGTTEAVTYGCNDGGLVCCWVKDVKRLCDDNVTRYYTFQNRVEPGICDGSPWNGTGCIRSGVGD
ncbi:MAG: hypothetical protein LCH41_14820 [Armatimonadetes bacterium]|nr:hypothetical protein [Armatimonadota bacterium]